MSEERIDFKAPEIYFPKLFTAVSETVPHIELTSKEAVAAGFSFRRKRHSVKITSYHGRSHKDLIIPYSIDGMPVDEIGREVFRNYPCCTISVHGRIRRLGEGVFRGSTVQKILFEDGITSLSDYTFYQCELLKEIGLPLTLKNIGSRCFMSCKSLRYIGFPTSIRNIGKQAFYGSGLEGFGVEAPTPGINNMEALSTRSLYDKDVICTYPDTSHLTVLHVRNGGAFRIKADSVTFCRNSLADFSLDLSECGSVRFYRNAVYNKRPKNEGHRGNWVNPSLIILPEKQDNDLHYAFPERVSAVSCYTQNESSGTKQYKAEYDSTYDTYMITPAADFLPTWTYEEEYERIRIKKRVHIERNAIHSRALKEITLEDFCAEDRIFSSRCRSLRKVSFSYKGRMVTKYIPPYELISLIPKLLLLTAFAPCSAPSGSGFRRTFYDRRGIDSVFRSKTASSEDNRWLCLLMKKTIRKVFPAVWIIHSESQTS